MKFLNKYIFIPVLLTAFLIFFFSVYQEFKIKTLNNFNSEQQLIAKSASQGISDYLGNLQSSLIFLSMSPDLIDFNDKGKELAGKFFENRSKQIEAITRISPTGIIMYTYPEKKDVIGMDVSYQKHNTEIIQNQKPVVSDVFMAVQGYLAIAVHVPVFKGSEFKGSLALLIAIDKIGKRYLENIKKGESGYALLLSEINIEIYCPFQNHISKSIIDVSQNHPSVLNLIEQIKKDDSGTFNCFHDSSEELTKTEKNVNFYRVPLGNTYWTILISYPQSEITKPIAGFRNRLILLFIVLVAVILVYFYFFTKVRKILKEENKRKIAEKALSESEEKYRLLHETAGVGIGYYTPDGTVISYNTIAAQNMNGKPEDFAGKSIFDLFPKEVAEFYFKRIQKAINSKTPEEYEDKVELATNTKWFSSVYNRIQDSNQKIIGIQIISTDITDRKQAELALKQSQGRLIEAERIGQMGSWVYVVATQKIEWSDGMFSIYGRNRETDEVTYETLLGWIHPDDRDEHNKYLERMLAMTHGSSLEAFKYRVLLPDGVIKWVNVKCECEYDKLGKPLLFVGTVLDITKSKLAEDERKKFVLLANNSSEFIGMCDLGLNTLYVNPAGIQMVGLLNLEAACNVKIQDYFFSDDKKFIEEEFFPRVMQEGHGEVEIRLRHFQTGEAIWMSYYIFHLRDANNKLIGWATVSRNITDRKVAEEKVKKLNLELEQRVAERTQELSNSQIALLNLVDDIQEKSAQLEASQANLKAKNKELETFTYSVSHDLKAPLRGIDGYSKLLQDLYQNRLDDEANMFLANIRDSAHKMNQLIDDLLEYSRLERSQKRVGKIKIKDLINSILKIYKEELDAAGFNLIIKFDDLEIDADPKGITIALRNLIENAIKFTKGRENPKLEISIDDKTSSWIIKVKDNGIGFDMKYEKKIFEIFHRLHRAEDFPGTGIGLAMVSKAMQRMNGSAGAESTLNVGSTFFLEIPKLT
jgi:PAS domain S-box-containing protein